MVDRTVKIACLLNSQMKLPQKSEFPFWGWILNYFWTLGSFHLLLGLTPV